MKKYETKFFFYSLKTSSERERQIQEYGEEGYEVKAMSTDTHGYTRVIIQRSN